MANLIKKRSRKSGLPPGSLVHIGERKVRTPKISIIDYDEAKFWEERSKKIEECFVFKERPTITWVNIDGLHQTSLLEALGDCYGFHPLVLEDILNTDQRPKIEDYGDYLYIVLRSLEYNERKKEIESDQISIILGRNFVFSFQEKEGDTFDAVRERIRTGKGRIRKMGADYLVHALLDSIVDNYFFILEKLGERIEFLEEQLVTQPTTETLRTIHGLKRELIFLRKAVWPLREVVGSLERGESPLIQESTRIYLRDLYDHTIQVIDNVETFRDMIAGILDIYLSSVSNRLNTVMKVLTVIATIFMPLTFLAGIYGMNFKFMPELEWRWGYPLLWGVMVATGISMMIYFKKKKWL
ncbi:MAG: magnesium and cobalt transport protein CorA [Deltaproteobacteria bacterium RBG_16_54_18]|nr:MAG: magnesium and cobalt transport protein CorA [Deltaproteobacteria bacterium RBG_16_54_18]